MSEIKALTGIRGIAALGVMLLHFGPDLQHLWPGFAILLPIYNNGHFGVDLFFILSGFIISKVYSTVANWDRAERYRYFLKRVARIYPVHLVTLSILGSLVAGSILILHRMPAGRYGIPEFFYHLLMLQAYLGTGCWNYPSWSISAEFVGYILIYPVTVAVFRHAAARRWGILIAILLLLSFTLPNAAGFFGRWRLVFNNVFEFAAGAAIYHGLSERPKLASLFAKVLPFIVLSVGVFCFCVEPWAAVGVTMSVMVLFAASVVAGLAADVGPIAKVLGTRFFRYLGLISYSLYMGHALVQKIYKIMLPVGSFAGSSAAVRLGVFAVYVITPVLLAILLYHGVEEPSRRWVQRVGGRFAQARERAEISNGSRANISQPL